MLTFLILQLVKNCHYSLSIAYTYAMVFSHRPSLFLTRVGWCSSRFIYLYHLQIHTLCWL